MIKIDAFWIFFFLFINQSTDLFSLLPRVLTLSKKLLWNNKNDPMFGMAGGFFLLFQYHKLILHSWAFHKNVNP